jgi:hypothetical protein
MIMTNSVEIIEFLENFSGIDPIDPYSDLFRDIGIVGDDFHEMIVQFASKYAVDMANYLWYFHTDEEGSNWLGGSFFDPPYKHVKRIPVTPIMLTEFASKGKWDIQYPVHKIPNKRYDLIINQVVFGLVLILLFIGLVEKCSK